jgi:hypothetical protein
MARRKIDNPESRTGDSALQDRQSPTQDSQFQTHDLGYPLQRFVVHLSLCNGLLNSWRRKCNIGIVHRLVVLTDMPTLNSQLSPLNLLIRFDEMKRFYRLRLQ